MGRSQVQYNRTHGRGRGRTNTTNKSDEKDNTKTKKESQKNRKNKVNDIPSNSWRYNEEELNNADSNNFLNNNQSESYVDSMKDRITSLSSNLQRSDLGNDDDEILLSTAEEEKSSSNDMLYIDKILLTDAFLQIPIKQRLYLQLNSIAIELERGEDHLGDDYTNTDLTTNNTFFDTVDSKIGKDFNDKVFITNTTKIVIEDTNKLQKKKTENDHYNNKMIDNKNVDHNKEQLDEEEDDLDAWLDDAIAEEKNDASNNEDMNSNRNEDINIQSLDSNVEEEAEVSDEDDLDAWLDDVIS